MSTLKVNKLRDTAGAADAITLDPNGGAVLSGVTTVSTIKVGSGVTISSDGDIFHTGVCTATTFSGAFSGNAANCTSIPAANIVGLATAGFNRSGGFGGRTISASATLNSTSVDFTGFSADTTRFDVIFRSVGTASVDFGVRIGDSGGIETATYRCRSGFNRSSDNVAEENAGGFFTHGLAGSYTTSGFMTFISLTNSQHRWQCFGRFTENATDSHVFVVDGYRHLDSALTQIRILPESGSFSGGEVHLVTYVD